MRLRLRRQKGLNHLLELRIFRGVFCGLFRHANCFLASGQGAKDTSRQPLPYNLHSGPWGIGPTLVPTERPAHTALIGAITVAWPSVLHVAGLILGVLLGGDSEGGVVVFSTLQNARARRDILNAIADFRIPDHRRRELFDAVLNVARYTETERNHLAHGSFGVSAALPDSILWVETKHFGPWNVATVRKDSQTTPDEFRELAKHIFVYTHSDLQSILDQVVDTFNILSLYLDYIRHPLPDGPTDEARYRQLCSSPRLATAINQIRSGKRNNS
jgi:hypothetical protein